MENITIKINGMEVSAPKGSTILEAARLGNHTRRRKPKPQLSGSRRRTQ